MPRIELGFNAETLLSGLENAKARKLREINDACDKTLGMLTETYPNAELLTFDQQKAEALARQSNPNAECPLLTPLATARGISLDELCRRVLAKAAAFSAASGHVIGQRQAKEDALDACTTIDQVEAIQTNYTLPGGEA